MHSIIARNDCDEAILSIPAMSHSDTTTMSYIGDPTKDGTVTMVDQSGVSQVGTISVSLGKFEKFTQSR